MRVEFRVLGFGFRASDFGLLYCSPRYSARRFWQAPNIGRDASIGAGCSRFTTRCSPCRLPAGFPPASAGFSPAYSWLTCGYVPALCWLDQAWRWLLPASAGFLNLHVRARYYQFLHNTTRYYTMQNARDGRSAHLTQVLKTNSRARRKGVRMTVRMGMARRLRRVPARMTCFDVGRLSTAVGRAGLNVL